jgi:hypothetical protein
MPKFCPFCGKPLPHPDAEVCQACGAQVRPQVRPQARPQARPQVQPPVQPGTQSQVQPGTRAQPQARPPAAPAAREALVRNPFLAVIFSFFFPGWGQWYNGQRWEGLKFFLASLIIVLIALASTFLLKDQASLVSAFSVVLGLASIGVWLYGMYHAYTTAQRINQGAVVFERKSRLFWLPVALIILMIVMLIIAAVFAAFIFGMAGTLIGQGGPGQGGYERTKSVAATARQTGDTIYVTWQGGQDNDLVSSYSIAISSSNGQPSYMGDLPPIVGDMHRFDGGTSGNDHVVVMASFTDGTQQGVLDTYV